LFESFLSQLGTTHCFKKYFFYSTCLTKEKKTYVAESKNLMCNIEEKNTSISDSYTRIMIVFCFL
jgi:hypothetical protein